MSRFRLSEATWWKVIFVLFAVLVFFNAFGGMFGRIEGRLWPVKHDAVLINVRPIGDAVRFDGVAQKSRDCELDHVEWFFVYGDTEQELDLVRRGRPQFTGLGIYRFYNWELFITQTELLNNTYALAYHRCHPFYKTISVFFKGEGIDK